jgi:hypothetical protein
MERTIERLTTQVLDALSRGESVGPLALTLLVRRYAATDRQDLADALGPALAAAAERDFSAPAASDADWLTLLVESCGVSSDARLRSAAERLIGALRRRWAAAVDVESAMWSIGACLSAADLVDPRELVPAAIDELERIVGATYRPGAGLGHLVASPDAERGQLHDHVRAASALLTAYDLTARVPYAMLAEELIQFAMRQPLALDCEAARVLIRLAALHATPSYRAAAVLAPDVDYTSDAARVLAAFEPDSRARGADEVAVFGLALTEWTGRP